MAIPRIAEIRPGTRVNITLKADQGSGRLTSGQVSDILTRGDHPRGVKVRLADGQIGRVQSLCSPASGSSGNAESVVEQAVVEQARVEAVRARGRGQGLQDDYRLEPEPAATMTSLLDYVKKPKLKKGTGGSAARSVEALSPQQQLETEFPGLDSALVAAILVDHELDLSSARATLSSLS